MKNVEPYKFDNFTISDNPTNPVLDLKLNRVKNDGMSTDTEKTLKNIEAELKFLLDDKKSDKLQFVKTMLRELSPILLEKESLAIVSDFIAKNFRRFATEKRLDFYLHPNNITDIKNIISTYAERFGYEGKIYLHKDASINPCDCKVVWSGNEAEYNSKQILEKLEKVLMES